MVLLEKYILKLKYFQCSFSDILIMNADIIVTYMFHPSLSLHRFLIQAENVVDNVILSKLVEI